MIKVTDSGAGALSFTQSFNIAVVDTNDAPTNVELSASTLDENAGPNAVVGTLTTEDPDTSDLTVSQKKVKKRLEQRLTYFF